jgi:hypothetical protein
MDFLLPDHQVWLAEEGEISPPGPIHVTCEFRLKKGLDTHACFLNLVNCIPLLKRLKRLKERRRGRMLHPLTLGGTLTKQW